MARKINDRPHLAQGPFALNIVEWDEGGAPATGWFGIDIKYYDDSWGENATPNRPSLRVVIDEPPHES